MDRSYILFNALVYGSIASALSGFFAYAKFLNLSLGSYMMGAGFVVYLFAMGRSLAASILLSVLVVSYIAFYTLLLRDFAHDKQRDLVALITSLMLWVVLANILQFFFGSRGIFLSVWHIPVWMLLGIFVCVAGGIYYIFEKTHYSIVFKWLFEKAAVIQSLGIPSGTYRHVLYIFWLAALFGISALILHTSGLKAVDGLFYLLKGLAIMILVGIGNKKYIFLWALLYVFVEYVLFIKLWWSIAYKESMIMVVILFVLLFRPEWLFGHKTRSI